MDGRRSRCIIDTGAVVRRNKKEGWKGMEKDRVPQPGQIYNHFKNKLYQIITLGYDAETGEAMVVYQALYGEFKTYIRKLESFLSEVDHVKYPEVVQKYRFELKNLKEESTSEPTERQMASPMPVHAVPSEAISKDEGRQQVELQSEVPEQKEVGIETPEVAVPAAVTEINGVNAVLLKFLDADSFYKKLEVITSNRKHMNDRVINDMAVSLDCTVEEGPLENRIQGLIFCLQALCRFEDKRLR
jgi:hypothetical protein